jgi:hypothetical protein
MLWWLVALFIAAAVFYAYRLTTSIKIAGKGNCASCPKHLAKEKGF